MLKVGTKVYRQRDGKHGHVESVHRQGSHVPVYQIRYCVVGEVGRWTSRTVGKTLSDLHHPLGSWRLTKRRKRKGD